MKVNIPSKWTQGTDKIIEMAWGIAITGAGEMIYFPQGISPDIKRGTPRKYAGCAGGIEVEPADRKKVEDEIYASSLNRHAEWPTVERYLEVIKIALDSKPGSSEDTYGLIVREGLSNEGTRREYEVLPIGDIDDAYAERPCFVYRSIEGSFKSVLAAARQFAAEDDASGLYVSAWVKNDAKLDRKVY